MTRQLLSLTAGSQILPCSFCKLGLKPWTVVVADVGDVADFVIATDWGDLSGKRRVCEQGDCASLYQVGYPEFVLIRLDNACVDRVQTGDPLTVGNHGAAFLPEVFGDIVCAKALEPGKDCEVEVRPSGAKFHYLRCILVAPHPLLKQELRPR